MKAFYENSSRDFAFVLTHERRKKPLEFQMFLKIDGKIWLH